MSIKEDIEKTKLVKNGYESDKYGKIYFHSNERLKDIFSQLDVKDKNVFTVLASGDQAFYFYDNGAKKVDLFDINKLSIYYYYLRVWIINYLGRFYPRTLCNEFIKDLLDIVEVKSEEEREAVLFWKKYIKNFSNGEINELLYFSENPFLNKINDVSNLASKLKEKKFNFYNIDISGKIEVPNKYNIIYTSNAADYLYHDKKTFESYRDNLDELLDDDGIVVCANVLRGRASIIEREVFSHKFLLSDLEYIEDKHFCGSPGYVYKRR